MLLKKLSLLSKVGNSYNFSVYFTVVTDVQNTGLLWRAISRVVRLNGRLFLAMQCHVRIFTIFGWTRNEVC